MANQTKAAAATMVTGDKPTPVGSLEELAASTPIAHRFRTQSRKSVKITVETSMADMVRVSTTSRTIIMEEETIPRIARRNKRSSNRF